MKESSHTLFGISLEERARILAGDLKPKGLETSITSSLEREIALVLDQIDETRVLHEGLRRKLIRVECEIGTDLMHLYPRPTQYVDEHWGERNSLNTRLQRIDEEKRRLAIEESEKLNTLHDRLLSLLNKLEHLRL